MKERLLAETTTVCALCSADAAAAYYETCNGVFLRSECALHGVLNDKVETDTGFFLEQYMQPYYKAHKHFVVPVTYRCMMRCRYCYSLSSDPVALPCDRPLEKFAEMFSNYDGNIMLSGGEPTLRDDLPDIIKAAKKGKNRKKVSIATNGQKNGGLNYLETLRESGLDYIFLSLHDKTYYRSEDEFIRALGTLNNCRQLGIPVWISRTVERLDQLDSISRLLEEYKKTIFQVTLRAVKRYGALQPLSQLYLSSLIAYLGMEENYQKGRSPFNVYITLKGKRLKLCSWVFDTGRLDPIDDDYLLSNDSILPFHRGMKIDETLLLRRRMPQFNTVLGP